MGPPRGPSNGSRGGYMGPAPGRGGRGGMMPPRGPPTGYGPGPGGPNRGVDPYGRAASPPMDDPYSYGPPSQTRQPSPGHIGMAVSPDIVGQAIEMTPQQPQYEHESTQPMSSVPHGLSAENNGAPESPTSMYSRPG
jgi:hypothetical protein